ncbi:MAG TPA: hypothetical protein VGO48_13780 [Conexibacter sp.]|jgi:hypothetical protein|nr:hypothetical protein [Conexibacter sp.]
MRGVRDLWTELVERRLWPGALLLVVALVAVPVVLAKKPSADEASTGTAALPAAAAARAADLRTAGEPVVSVATGAGADAPLRGHAKNPFKQQHVPVRAAAEGGTPATGTTPAPTGASGGGTDTGSGGNSGGAGGDQGQTPQTYMYAAIDVRFGRAGLPLRTIHDVPRLTPLPSATQPIVIFMGMRADHETAVFMVSTDVHAQGEGRCVPSKKLCEAIELRRDQIALLDWAEPDGSVTQYELDLADVTLHETTSKAKAQATVAEARASWMQRDRAGASVRRHSTPQAAAGTAPRGPSLVPLP